MTRISQLQTPQALEAAKNLDEDANRQEIRSLAHDMNIAASPDVAVSALKEKIVEVLEYHNAKLERKQLIADGADAEDVPDLPAKPNLRVTTVGKVVPDKLESEVDHVAAEDPSSAENPEKKDKPKKAKKSDDEKTS